MPLIWWYSILGSCIACYVLGCLHTLASKPRRWRCLALAVAAGALWPITLLLGLVSDWAEHESA
jgi:hypothetical protein